MTNSRWIRLVAASFALLLIAPLLCAQLPSMSDTDRGNGPPSAGPLPEWDAALIKPHPANDPGMMWKMTPDGLSLVNLSLEQMICSGWDLKPYQLSGLNGWMKITRFDLTAKVSGGDVASYKKLNDEQRQEMLQKLLIERFQMKFHMETKTLPVYDLVVDKGGSKLKLSTALEAPFPEDVKAEPDKYKKGYMSMGAGMFEGWGITVQALASQLSNELGKPVRDATFLTGSYDITLHFRPEAQMTGAVDTNDLPSVFSVVQEQLGLKLVPTRGPVKILVVESAQTPQAN